MPQGKGTYGSQVGRPPKKKYQAGGNVDPFSTRNSEGLPTEMIMEAIEKQNMIPESNAMERSETSPDTEQYKEGGKVDERGKFTPEYMGSSKDKRGAEVLNPMRQSNEEKQKMMEKAHKEWASLAKSKKKKRKKK